MTKALLKIKVTEMQIRPVCFKGHANLFLLNVNIMLVRRISKKMKFHPFS